MSNQVIYKIVSETQWKLAEEKGVFGGSQVDFEDGYIHFSTSEQVAETAAKHFAGQDDLLLVSVSEDKLGDSVRWEESRGGQLFPHFYGDLMVGSVDDVQKLSLDKDGNHIFPEF